MLFISIITASALHQIIRRQISEVGDPCVRAAQSGGSVSKDWEAELWLGAQRRWV